MALHIPECVDKDKEVRIWKLPTGTMGERKCTISPWALARLPSFYYASRLGLYFWQQQQQQKPTNTYVPDSILQLYINSNLYFFLTIRTGQCYSLSGLLQKSDISISKRYNIKHVFILISILSLLSWWPFDVYLLNFHYIYIYILNYCFVHDCFSSEVRS